MNFKIDLNEVDKNNAWDELNNFINDVNEANSSYIKELSKELKITENCAADVWYLRQRSRWTQALENELIKLHNEGNPPNICDFGN